MSLLDKLTGRTPEQDEMTEKALQQQREADQRKGELLQDVERLQAALTEARQQLGAATYSGAGEECERLQNSIEKLQSKIGRTKAAITIADQKIAAAERQLHQANMAGRLRTYRRLTTKRAKHTAELSEALAGYVTAHRKVRETNDQLSIGWPFSAGVVPEAALTSPHDLNNAIGKELALLAGVSPLDDKGWLPGASTHTLLLFGGKPASLLEETELANAYVLQLIEAGPSGPVSIQEPVSMAPPPSAPDIASTSDDRDPDRDLLVLNPNPVEFVAQPRSASVLIDHRKVQS